MVVKLNDSDGGVEQRDDIVRGGWLAGCCRVGVFIRVLLMVLTAQVKVNAFGESDVVFERQRLFTAVSQGQIAMADAAVSSESESATHGLSRALPGPCVAEGGNAQGQCGEEA